MSMLSYVLMKGRGGGGGSGQPKDTPGYTTDPCPDIEIWSVIRVMAQYIVGP